MATCNKITICKGEDGKYEIKNKEPLEDDTPALVDNSNPGAASEDSAPTEQEANGVEDADKSAEPAEATGEETEAKTGSETEAKTGTEEPSPGEGGKRRRRRRKPRRKSRRKSKSRKSKRRKSSKKKSVKVKASTMRKHSKNHTKRHMKYMKKMMKKGYSFKKAHRSTMRKVGK
jgi:hypothetical protein